MVVACVSLLLLDDLEILNKLSYLNSEMHAFDAVHAFISVLFLKVGGEFMHALSERYDVSILFLVEVKTNRDAVFFDFRIHRFYLILQCNIGITHVPSFYRKMVLFARSPYTLKKLPSPEAFTFNGYDLLFLYPYSN